MRRKWKQIWASLLMLAMIALLMACGENVSDDLQEVTSDSLQESVGSTISDEQIILPTDGNTGTDSVVEQTNPISLYKTISKYSSDGMLQQVIECTYDDNDLTLSCDVVESGERYIFSYDMFGRIIDEKAINSNGVLINWESLDKDGNKAADMEYNNDGTIYMGYQYQYDESGNKTKYINHATDGSYYEEDYDENGNEIKTTYYGTGGSIERSVLYDYEYDFNGNIIVKNITNSDGWTYRVEYEYDASGNNIKETTYDADGVVMCWYEYEYDVYGNMVRSSNYEKYSGEDNPRHVYTCTWEYDSDGNIRRYVWYRADGSVNFEDEYDSKGRFIKEQYFDKDGSFLSGHEYKYDADENIIQILFYEDGVICSGQTYEYEYGSNGEITLRKMKHIIDGNDLGRTEYEYDTEGNMLRSSTYDSKGNAVITDYQTVFFGVGEEKQQTSNLIQYIELIQYDVPVDTSEYYDYVLGVGDNYMLVAKEVEDVTSVVEYVGVINSEYEWVFPLSADTPIQYNGKITGEWTGYSDFEHRCEMLSETVQYAGDGVFIIGLPYDRAAYTSHGTASVLDLYNNSWYELEEGIGFRSMHPFIFIDGYYVASDSGWWKDNDCHVLIFNRTEDSVLIEDTEIYCDTEMYLGRYSEGLFFSFDGFYDIDGDLKIDLSEYAGLIINQPYFQNGRCELVAKNPNGTKYEAVIDLNGLFISEFTKIEE